MSNGLEVGPLKPRLLDLQCNHTSEIIFYDSKVWRTNSEFRRIDIDCHALNSPAPLLSEVESYGKGHGESACARKRRDSHTHGRLSDDSSRWIG